MGHPDSRALRLAWLLGGWSESIPDHAIAAYVDDARAAGAYLQPSDRVAARADSLGVIRNQWVP